MALGAGVRAARGGAGCAVAADCGARCAAASKLLTSGGTPTRFLERVEMDWPRFGWYGREWSGPGRLARWVPAYRIQRAVV